MAIPRVLTALGLASGDPARVQSVAEASRWCIPHVNHGCPAGFAGYCQARGVFKCQFLHPSVEEVRAVLVQSGVASLPV
jgi:hypothetical protein